MLCRVFIIGRESNANWEELMRMKDFLVTSGFRVITGNKSWSKLAEYTGGVYVPRPEDATPQALCDRLAHLVELSDCYIKLPDAGQMSNIEELMCKECHVPGFAMCRNK